MAGPNWCGSVFGKNSHCMIVECVSRNLGSSLWLLKKSLTENLIFCATQESF